MKQFSHLTFIILMSLSWTLGFASLKRPPLIVVISIDQFRADYLMRFEQKFLSEKLSKNEVGGFRYLMSRGAYYPYGHYDVIQNVTAEGHTTILSGSYPYQAGIPMNEWYNRKLKEVEYCVQDSASPLVGSLNPSEDLGMSPKNLNASTVGDELKNSGYSSRVVSIALKDRAAILLGGHRADLALWYDFNGLRWISSRYYLPQGKLPDWVNRFNHQHEEDQGKGNLASTYGVEITEKLAEEAINSLHLGQGPSTDLLAISFSPHDMIGHAHGPNSKEIENITLDEDRVISKLLNFIRKKLPTGLKDVIIVLTGDHGVAPSPDWAKERQLNAGKIDERLLGQKISTHLTEKFGKPTQGDWVVEAHTFNFYLNRPAIAAKKLDLAHFEAEAKAALLENPGVAFVVTSEEISQRRLPPFLLEREILHSYYPSRSGDLILIPRPYFVSRSLDSPPGSTNHSSGYNYDRTVPILFFGLNIRPGIYSNRAEVVDIAPTLSFLAGTVPPNLSEGRVLSEILNTAH